MNTAIRNGIKVALAKKYIDGLGLELPKLPSRPKFELPPMPDLSSLKTDAMNMTSSAGGSLNDLYTEEYKRVVADYNNELEKAKSVYDSKKENLETKIEEKISLGEDATELYVELEKIEYEYKKAKAEALKKANSSNIVKFKELGSTDENKVSLASTNDVEQKRSAAKAAASQLMQISIVQQYNRYVKKEMEVVNRLFAESIKMYNDSKELYTNAVGSITEYFKPGGDGDAWVEDECNKIDRIWDNLSELFKELGTDISVMVAKIPNPDVLVVGAAVGSPNPGFKILVFMENFKKVMTDITKIANYVKEIIDIAKKMGYDILKFIGVFASMMKLIEALQGNVDKQFKNAVRQFKKRTKWSAQVNKMDDDKEDYLVKRAGYKYADIEVDYTNKTINLLGYKCYCTKNKDFLDGYKKNGGSYRDEKGKRYYYLKEEDITHAYDDYADLDLDEEGGLGETLGAASYDYTNNTTTLQLSDGRIVTIDYLASEGDYIHLNDGTKVHVI